MLQLMTVALTLAGGADAARLKLRADDRIVFVGDGLIERMQKHSRLESALLCAFPTLRVSFRNLGWSGDTVEGRSRCYFDPPAAGFDRLVEHVRTEKPTVLFIGYGASDAFAGENGLVKFRRDYERLLDRIAVGCDRVVLIGTPPPIAKPAPFPNVETRRRDLAAYNAAIEDLAANRGCFFVDLHKAFAELSTEELDKTSRTGIEFYPRGYRVIDAAIVRQTGLLDPGVSIDSIASHPLFPEVERIVEAKNELYFLKYRPQNITYLLGFRKHEQGQNAAELEQLGRLVVAEEQRLDELRRSMAPGD